MMKYTTSLPGRKRSSASGAGGPSLATMVGIVIGCFILLHIWTLVSTHGESHVAGASSRANLAPRATARMPAPLVPVSVAAEPPAVAPATGTSAPNLRPPPPVPVPIPPASSHNEAAPPQPRFETIGVRGHQSPEPASNRPVAPPLAPAAVAAAIPEPTASAESTAWYPDLLTALAKNTLLRRNVRRKELMWLNASLSESLPHLPPHSDLPSDAADEGRELALPEHAGRESARSSAPVVYSPLRRRQLRVLLYCGWVAFYDMEKAALNRNGPAGEFVIWGDLVAGLAALGYRVTIVDSKTGLWSHMRGSKAAESKPENTTNPNPVQPADPEAAAAGGDAFLQFWDLGMAHPPPGPRMPLFDVIITDYDGLGTLENTGDFPRHHCKYYLVDGFGTQPAFNSARHLDMKRVLTPYPFDDGANTNIGIVTHTVHPHLLHRRRVHRDLDVSKYAHTAPPPADAPANIGILWLRLSQFVSKNRSYVRNLLLAVLREVDELHVSLGVKELELMLGNPSLAQKLRQIPRNAVSNNMLQLMMRAKFFLAIGPPHIDGPSAMEAIAHGCTYIAPRFDPPLVLESKPTARSYTSHHPYIEHNFPKHTFRLYDMHNISSLREALKDVLHASPRPVPYIHPSNTAAWYVRNLDMIFGANGSHWQCYARGQEQGSGNGKGKFVVTDSNGLERMHLPLDATGTAESGLNPYYVASSRLHGHYGLLSPVLRETCVVSPPEPPNCTYAMPRKHHNNKVYPSYFAYLQGTK